MTRRAPIRYGRPKARRSKWDKPVTSKLCAMPGCDGLNYSQGFCRRHVNPDLDLRDPAAFFDMSAAQQRQAKGQEGN